MTRSISQIRIVVASPSDVLEHRKVVFDTLAELNRSLDVRGISILGVGWEEYITPGIGDEAQSLINKELLPNYDIMIALFGTRLGTPTKSARSGTVEEIEKALTQGSPFAEYRVQIYFLDRLESISAISMTDLQAVMSYQTELGNRGLFYRKFTDGAGLAREVRVNVLRAVNHFLSFSENAIAPLVNSTPEIKYDEPGILDLQEAVEKGLEEGNSFVNEMAEIVGQIAEETVKKTREFEIISDPHIPSSVKKTKINEFAAFLKSKSRPLHEKALAAKASFTNYLDSVAALIELKRAEFPQSVPDADRDAYTALETFLAKLLEARQSTTGYRGHVEVFPRMTIQFNQAKKEWLAAVDACIDFFVETEAKLTKLMRNL